MNIAVRYYTKSGNTKKLADAIAKVAGVEAHDVSHPLNEKVDILFLGSSVYAAGVDESVKRFIADNKANIGVIYNFSTAALISSTYKQIKKIAQQNGVSVSEKEFHCRGAFAQMHKGRPNSEDIKGVEEFAKEIIG